MMESIPEKLGWILVGIVLTVIFQGPIEQLARVLVRRFKFFVHPHRPITHDEFQVGEWHSPWVRIEGTSTNPCTPANVICRLDPTPVVLPEERQFRKNQIEKEQAEKAKIHGKRDYFNGPTVALVRIDAAQVGPAEDPQLLLEFQKSDYYTYLATAKSLGEEIEIEQGKKITVRDKYLTNIRYDSPNPAFASAVSLNLSVITSDGFIVLSKRAKKGVVSYQDYIMPAICETINPDKDAVANNVILFRTAHRGAKDELHIEITEDELIFFSIGVDTKWYFHDLTGLIRLKNFSKADIQSRRTVGGRESWESQSFYYLPVKPLDRVVKEMQKLSETEQWGSTGLVCVIQTLIHVYGYEAAESLLRKYPPRKIKTEN